MADRSTTRTIRARPGGEDPLHLWDDGPDEYPGRWAPSTADGPTVDHSALDRAADHRAADHRAADHRAADHHAADRAAVLIDCDTCAVRGPGCGDCVVTVLLGMPAPPVHIGADQVAALGVLAGSGLVPPLRHDRADRLTG